MELEFVFEYPHTNWSPPHVFKGYYDFFVKTKKNKKIKVSFVNASNYHDGNPSGFYSPHHMIIRNKLNRKYVVVSYWDRPHEITWKGMNWETDKCVEIFTSTGFEQNPKFVPFTYLCWQQTYDELSNNAKKIVEDRKSTRLNSSH